MPKPTFPTTDLAFQRQFATDEACFEFVRSSRWPDGFRCPSCDHPGAYERADRWGVECAGCGRIVSVTAGTVMHKTHVPIRSWLWAAWLMVTSKRGLSALELQRRIGVAYKTAFTMLHRLRHAMVAPERTRLTGRVEVDETYVGGPVRGRGSGKFRGAQAIVVGAVEVRNDAPARIRLRSIEIANRATLHTFIRENVHEGATVATDGNPAYLGLNGYQHLQQVAGRDGLPEDEILIYFHTMIGNLKAWLLGTHHGAVRAKHLQPYLNEFAYRFNRRRNLQAAFQTLLGLIPRVGPLSYEDLFGDEQPRRNPSARGAD